MHMLLPRQVRWKCDDKDWDRWSQTYLNTYSQIFKVSECYYVTFCTFDICCILQNSVLPHSYNKDTKTIPISEYYFDFNLCVNKIFGLTKKRLFTANYVFLVISPGSSVNCRVLIHFWPINMNGAIILKHNTFVLSHLFQMCLKARGKST